uniref:Uncharacterized protein n=1 Tax=Cucumis melo TaxID=3656 RepID=A0A9I9E5D4_CUCME
MPSMPSDLRNLLQTRVGTTTSVDPLFFGLRTGLWDSFNEENKELVLFCFSKLCKGVKG